jgi:histone H3/H4
VSHELLVRIVTLIVSIITLIREITLIIDDTFDRGDTLDRCEYSLNIRDHKEDMARLKNRPQTRNTARKSTATVEKTHRSSSERRHERSDQRSHERLDERYHERSHERSHERLHERSHERSRERHHERSRVRITQRRSNPDSRQMFARSESRLREELVNATISYNGPVGLGIGKGGLRRMRRSMPKRKDIERCSNYTESAIPLASFARLVKSILVSIDKASYRFQVASIQAMREALEAYAIEMFETSNMFVHHARRVTVMCKDLALYKRVRPDKR